jgi:hypothetical protein
MHAVDHAVSHGLDRCETILLFEPIAQKGRCRFVVGNVQESGVLVICGRELERQIRPAHADAINSSMKASLQRFAKLVLREFDAR